MIFVYSHTVTNRLIYTLDVIFKNVLKMEYQLVDLETFKTDIETTINILNKFRLNEKTLICESGINNKEDINYIFEKTKISNFLVGESLIRSTSIYDKMKELIA